MTQVPEGYMQDSKGNLVPEDKVKPIDKLRNDLVTSLIKQALGVADILAHFKSTSLSEISGFLDLSAAEYDAPYGGKKGNVTLTSFDGRYRVIRAVSEHIVFDERLQIAKALIDQCIERWSEGVNDNIRVLVDHAFQTNKEGRVSTARILGLRRLDITDPDWRRAMEAIADSIQVNDSTTYVRFYRRIGESDQYEQIPLDLASARPQKPETGTTS
tara:strand:- start:13668 stop:14312 length:645 start_codon:yes stop_codon:yes gene_type:complete